MHQKRLLWCATQLAPSPSLPLSCGASVESWLAIMDIGASLGDEFDFLWMSMNPGGVFGTDNLPFLAGLYSQQLLIVLWWQDVGPCRQRNHGALQWSSFQEERLGADGLSKI